MRSSRHVRTAFTRAHRRAGPAPILGCVGAATLFLAAPWAWAQPESAPKPPQPPKDEVIQRLDEQEKDIETLKNRLGELKGGNTKFLLTGLTAASFTAPEKGDSAFDAKFIPVFLWKISDNLFSAAAVEFEFEDNSTAVAVEYANLNLIATDWLAFRAGVFLHPMSTFQQQLHSPWINKLPDKPLYLQGGGTGFAQESTMGVEALGAFGTDVGKITYSAFVTNGPSLRTSGANAGALDLHDYSEVNSNKAIGGRLGFLPNAEFEFFYAFMFNNVTPSGSGLADVDLFTHDFGVSYVAEKDWLHGRIDARTEFAIADFQDNVDLGSGPFSNDRSGGYAQIAYRPTKADNALKDVEPVLRFDFNNRPSGAPNPADERRWTLGLNYWLNPKTVFKVAYQFDDIKDPSNTEQSNNALMVQFAMGF